MLSVTYIDGVVQKNSKKIPKRIDSSFSPVQYIRIKQKNLILMYRGKTDSADLIIL